MARNVLSWKSSFVSQTISQICNYIYFMKFKCGKLMRKEDLRDFSCQMPKLMSRYIHGNSTHFIYLCVCVFGAWRTREGEDNVFAYDQFEGRIVF